MKWRMALTKRKGLFYRLLRDIPPLLFFLDPPSPLAKVMMHRAWPIFSPHSDGRREFE